MIPQTDTQQPARKQTWVQGLGLIDSTMLVAGSMIGSGVFIVSADIARTLGATGWLLMAWLVTGALTVTAALSYGELAAMMPRAGGQYVYLREAYGPLAGFLYGWTLFLVIQTGTIAAVSVAFARYLGVVCSWVSPTAWIISPINLSTNYAISLSFQQLIAIIIIVVLTALNTRGLRLGKFVQNTFTSAKVLSLLALIMVGMAFSHADAIKQNFSNIWASSGVGTIKPDLSFIPVVSAQAGVFGLIVAFCVAQVGSLFSSDAWNNVTFTAGEVKNPKRNLPLSLALGTGLVTVLYLLANLAYLFLLPLDAIKNAADDRVATAAIETVFSGAGPLIMAVAIMISTFGCDNGLILSGARVYFAMARDALFFRSAGKLNERHVPAVGLVLQCVWACVLVLPRIRQWNADGSPKLDSLTGMQQYGNLYSNLLDYVVFAVLIFYVLTMGSIFVLRRQRPEAERPYRAFGYPVVPVLYMVAASAILLILLVYRTQTSWPGLLIVLSGIPVYYYWKWKAAPGQEA